MLWWALVVYLVLCIGCYAYDPEYDQHMKERPDPSAVVETVDAFVICRVFERVPGESKLCWTEHCG